MRRKRKQSSMVRYALILAIVLVLLIVLAASYRSEQVPPKKPEASDYFDITDAAYFPSNDIQQIGFTITAVGGDAHNVHVSCENLDVPELVNPNEDGTILEGEHAHVDFMLSNPFPLFGLSPGDEFPFPIHVISTEADGEVPLMLTKK